MCLPRIIVQSNLHFIFQVVSWGTTSGFESVSASLCLISLAIVKNTSSTFMFVLALWVTTSTKFRFINTPLNRSSDAVDCLSILSMPSMCGEWIGVLSNTANLPNAPPEGGYLNHDTCKEPEAVHIICQVEYGSEQNLEEPFSFQFWGLKVWYLGGIFILPVE